MNSASGWKYKILLTISPYQAHSINISTTTPRIPIHLSITYLVHSDRADLEVLLTHQHYKTPMFTSLNQKNQTTATHLQ